MRKWIANSILISLVALLFVSLPSIALASPSSESQVLRVGYIQDNKMLQTPFVAGSEGYGYEYLEKIVEYTEGAYTLEYISCTRADAYDLLESGEIDLLGLVAYSENYAEQGFVYTEYDFGEDALLLASMEDITIDQKSYEKLEGATVGSTVSAAHVEEVFAEYGRSVTAIELVTDDYEGAFAQYELDFCVISSMQFPDTENINILSQVESMSLYCVTSAENQDIIEDFNQAMAQIEQKEFYFQENLYQKYYSYSISIGQFISAEEYALVQSQAVYTVGLRNISAPFSNQDADGNWGGVAMDFFAMLEESAGITIEVVEIYDDTTAEELEALDFYFLAADPEEGSRKSEIFLSIALVTLDHAESIASADTIGVLDYYDVDGWVTSGLVLGRIPVVYYTLEEMIESFNNGEVESLVLTNASLNYIRDAIEDTTFLSASVNLEVDLGLTYGADFPEEKRAVFDKIILNMDTAELEYSLLENASQETVVTAFTYLQENPVAIFGLIALIGIFMAIVSHARHYEAARRNNFDALTGAYSLRRFRELTKERLAEAMPGDRYCIVSFDVDNFKYINEICGYTTGTKVIKRIGEIVKSELSKESLLARDYADNFLIFTKLDHVQGKTQLFAARGEAFSKELRFILGAFYRFSFSLGIYEIVDARVPVNYMVDCANVARELGKGTDGTTFHKFSEEINIERAQNNDIVANVEGALRHGEFELYYQPKLNLKTEKIVGAEALVRWNRNGKVVSPAHFIPLFEKNGFIQRFDFEVMEMACKFIKQNAAHGVPVISVNLSGITLARANIVQELCDIVAKYEVQPSQLDLEITESAFMGNDIAQNTVAALAQAGFAISMDDFGVGVSSLGRLKSLAIDTLKIDRAFIIDYLTNEKGTVILKSILGMAKALGMETVAEGIETKAQLESLRAFGCDVGQGYYFSRPVPESEFLAFCEHSKTGHEQYEI